jgi:Family of unknown function (DUF6062)
VTDTLFLADFRRAAQSPLCPFCALSETTITRYIGTLLNELTLAPDIHQKLAQSRGFCGVHAGQVEEMVQRQGGAGGGVAILYTSVCQSLRAALTSGLEEVPNAPAKPRWRKTTPASLGATLSARLQPTRPCLLCEHQDENEAFALAQLIEDLQETQGHGALAQLYQSSPGACLPHFQRLLTLARDDQAARWLAERQLAQWAGLEAALGDYRLGKSAGESWQQALAQLSGTSSRRRESRS